MQRCGSWQPLLSFRDTLAQAAALLQSDPCDADASCLGLVPRIRDFQEGWPWVEQRRTLRIDRYSPVAPVGGATSGRPACRLRSSCFPPVHYRYAPHLCITIGEREMCSLEQTSLVVYPVLNGFT